MNHHPALEPLRLQLRRLQWRWWWSLWLEGGSWLAVASWLASLAGVALSLLWIGLPVGLGLWGLWLWRTQPSPTQLAILADRRLSLDERLSTVLERVYAPAEGLQGMLLHDTLSRLKGLDWASVVSVSFPKGGLALSVVLATSALLAWLPITADFSASRPATNLQTIETLKRVVLATTTQANITASPQWQALAQQASKALQKAEASPNPLPAATLDSLSRQLEQVLAAEKAPSTLANRQPKATPTASRNRPSTDSPVSTLQAQVGKLESQQKARLDRQVNATRPNAPAADTMTDCHDGDCLDPSLVARIKAEEAALQRRKANLPQANAAGGSGERAGRTGTSTASPAASKVTKLQVGKPLNLRNLPSRPSQRISTGGVPRPASSGSTVPGISSSVPTVHSTREPPLPPEGELSPEQQATVARYFTRTEGP